MIQRFSRSPVEEHAGHDEARDDRDDHHHACQPERFQQDVSQSIILMGIDEFDDNRRLLKRES